MDALIEVCCSMFGESKGGGGISSFGNEVGSVLAGWGGSRWYSRGDHFEPSLNTSE